MATQKGGYLLSVIIPTKDREQFAIKSIAQVLEIDSEELQVVVQDNGASDRLYDLLKPMLADARLKYNRTESPLSFVDNFSEAVSQADGEYLCLIGDDDGVLPLVMGMVRWAKANNIDAITPKLNAVYFWPNSSALKSVVDDGCLRIEGMSPRARLRKAMPEVEKLLKRGATGYLSLNMVKLYHGVVRAACLEVVKEKTGRFFGGLSPDIYSSVALSLTVRQVATLDFPLTISGICSKSGSADSATGRHTGKLRDAPHFRGHGEYSWSRLVPPIYSVETIWADSALAAVREVGNPHLEKKFNSLALLVECLSKYPEMRNELLDFFSSSAPRTASRILALRFLLVLKAGTRFGRRVVRRLELLSSSYTEIHGIRDIAQASNALQSRMEGIGFDVGKISLEGAR